MTASSYDLTSPASSRTRRRFALPRLRAAGYGGGFALLVVAIGLLLIGIGWNGMAGGGGQVSGVSDLRAQLPWLVSGGILGLALVVFGAAMLIVHHARADRARLEAKLDEVVAALGRSTAGPAAGIPHPTTPIAATGNVYLAGGSSYHRADCRLVQGRDDLAAVTDALVTERNLRACRVCKPAGALASS
ncbi:MAG TPA: hypothetical protein VFT62_03855 [Mycobacteriales bacterium]|nr:hypothetical protein [Mycobacteriales bacterium]